MRAVWIWAVLVLGNVHLLLSSRATKGATHAVSESKSQRVENLSFHIKLDLVRPINVNDKETEIERSAIIFSNHHVRHRIAKRNANSSEPSESPVIPPVCHQPENSCSGRCTNSTEWRTKLKFACSCDPDCYEVFNDCCADYEQYCGRQKPKNVSTKKYNWTCEETGNFDSLTCTIGEGTWMVSQCAEKWPNDDTRTKCETPLKTVTISSSDFGRFLPVINPENVTFRNLYCGLCNKAKEPYEFWPVDIQTTVIPPKSYSLEEKIHFLLSYRANVITSDGPLRPKSSQPRRYCAEIKSSCDKPSSSCSNGPTAVVSAIPMSYRNIDCAVCNGAPSLLISCFPKTNLARTCFGFPPQPFLLVLDYQRNEKGEEMSKWSVKDEPCGRQGKIYDERLEVCRANWLHPPDQNRHERFYAIAWLAPQRVSKNNGFSPDDFQKSFAKYFDVSHTQILNINISSVRMPFTRFASGGAVNSFYVVSSTIILTPEQSLKLLSGNGDTHNTSKPSLLNFIYFKEPLSMVIIKNTSYTIVKTTSRPLACAGKTVYTPMEYTIIDQDKVYIDTTNTTYERLEYFRENSPQSNATLGNITVCKKYIPTGCNATWTILAPQQFTVMNNLSVYHKKTSSLYHYGEYDVLSNNSVAVCIQSTYTEPKVVNKAVCSGMVTILVGAGLSVSSFLFNF